MTVGPAASVEVISIHALRVEGDGHGPGRCGVPAGISIHALRVEGDAGILLLSAERWRISIHALRVEGDNTTSEKELSEKDFYPRPPCGGRHNDNAGLYWYMEISIHALRVEGDWTTPA